MLETITEVTIKKPAAKINSLTVIQSQKNGSSFGKIGKADSS